MFLMCDVSIRVPSAGARLSRQLDQPQKPLLPLNTVTMAQSVRCMSSKTTCSKSSSSRRTGILRTAAPFTAAGSSASHATPLRAAAQQQLRPHEISRHIVRVAAQEAPVETAGAQKTWYALVANAEWYFNDVQNEAMAEQMREKARFYREKNMETDFFFVPNPTWLDAKFPAQAKQVRRPCVALVSPDQTWINFMKVRLDRVMKLELSGMSEAEVLAMGEALPEFSRQGKWTAPYSAYAPKWWEVFYPKH